MNKSKLINLKDKINGSEMDLSLCNLREVPVKELAAFPKATVLDLSCNNITSLPPEICNLTHLVKVDLSKNQLRSLPEDLGRLGNLQHLDLYNNKLSVLPVSFSELKNLKWLDLKDNPLEPNLAKAAGDCLDEKQCKQCALRVLQHMRSIQEGVDKERERRLLKEKGRYLQRVYPRGGCQWAHIILSKLASVGITILCVCVFMMWIAAGEAVFSIIELEKKKEAQQRAREAKEREARKREKAEEKERRRKDYNAQMATLAAQEQQTKRKEEKRKRNGEAADQKTRSESLPEARCSLIGFLFKILVLMLLGLAGAIGACQLTGLKKDAVCVPINVAVDDSLSWASKQEDVLRQLVQKLSGAPTRPGTI